MKALVLNHEFPPIGGGAGGACRHLCAELVDLGVEVTVITASFGDLPSRDVVDGVTVNRVRAIRRRRLEAGFPEISSFATSACVTALRWVSTHDPDVVHAFFGVPSGAIAYTVMRLLGVPYIVSFRGRDVHGGRGASGSGLKGPMRWLSRPVWRNAAALVANSAGLREIALRTDPAVAVDVIPNGVDVERFSPNREEPESEHCSLLFVGRLEPYKRIEDLLRALALLINRPVGSVSLSIVGDGSMRAALPELTRRLGLEQHVHFVGAVDPERMPSVYRAADLLVLPSEIEGMPNVVLEAMASGLPVVATRVPGCDELVTPGETGYLVSPRSPDELADALYKLIADPATRGRMSDTARSRASRWSWQSVARSYLDLYRHVSRRQP